MNILYDDLLNTIYSFLIPKIENNELTLTNDIYFLNLSSKYLNITIQKYLKKYYNCYKIKYFNFINFACKNGHINILEWFKNSDYEFKYDESAIHFACKNGHINVLEWFKNSNYELKYCINYIKMLKNINILIWFKNNTNDFECVNYYLNVKYKRHTNFGYEIINQNY